MSNRATDQAMLAVAGAGTASAALVEFVRRGARADDLNHYDCCYPLAQALFLALTATVEGGRAPEDADAKLMATLSAWIEA